MLPLCRHFGECGGCSLQHLPYGDQLERKLLRLRSLMTSVPGASGAVRDFCQVSRVHPAGPTAFRQKVHFVLSSEKSGRVKLGHFGANSRRFVAVDECPVHAPTANELARLVVNVVNELGIEADPRGSLRHVIVRISESTGEAGLTLVVRRMDPRLALVARRVVHHASTLRFFCVNVKTDDGPLLTGRRSFMLFSHRRLVERMAGVRFALSPLAFFQTNVHAARLLVDEVMCAMGGSRARRVLDVYAGVGLFSIPLAAAGHRVVAIEGNADAAADCVENVRINRLHKSRCRVLTLSDWRGLQQLERERARFDAVVLDPPRSGCPAGFLERVLEWQRPARCVYVSCDPETLARDLSVALTRGEGTAYRISSIQPVDMFPHTDHIESVTVLDRWR